MTSFDPADGADGSDDGPDGNDGTDGIRRRRAGLGRRRGPSYGEPPLGWRRALAVSVLLVAVYFLAPMGEGDNPLPLVVAALLSVLAVILMALLVVRRIRRLVEDPSLGDLPTLSVLLVTTMVVFALGYFVLERSSPGQVAGLHTRLDSLYFTLVMITTVGFGDVHPAGQAARAITCLQLVFNAVFLGALIRTGTSHLSRPGSDRAGSAPRS